MIFIIVLIVLLVLFTVSCVKVVPQAEAAIVERLGSYLTTWGNGLHIKIPFIDRVRPYISLKEQVFDFPPQPVITKDNVTMQIDTVVYFQITDPKLYTCLLYTSHLKFADQWNKYIISSEPEFEHWFGKQATKKRKLYNGRLQCNVYMYY